MHMVDYYKDGKMKQSIPKVSRVTRCIIHFLTEVSLSISIDDDLTQPTTFRGTSNTHEYGVQIV